MPANRSWLWQIAACLVGFSAIFAAFTSTAVAFEVVAGTDGHEIPVVAP